jgi:hypothetical protein
LQRHELAQKSKLEFSEALFILQGQGWIVLPLEDIIDYLWIRWVKEVCSRIEPVVSKEGYGAEGGMERIFTGKLSKGKKVNLVILSFCIYNSIEGIVPVSGRFVLSGPSVWGW